MNALPDGYKKGPSSMQNAMQISPAKMKHAMPPQKVFIKMELLQMGNLAEIAWRAGHMCENCGAPVQQHDGMAASLLQPSETTRQKYGDALDSVYNRAWVCSPGCELCMHVHDTHPVVKLLMKSIAKSDYHGAAIHRKKLMAETRDLENFRLQKNRGRV